MTSLTVEEFDALAHAFEDAFQKHLAHWCLDGKPRTKRRFTVDTNCPLPTPEDRLLFVLVYLKTHPIQVAHGIMFGLPQGKTNQWLHVLLPLLRQALRPMGDAPARSIDELTPRLRVREQQLADATSPLFATMALRDVARVRAHLTSKKAPTAARRRVIPSQTCC